MSAAKEKPSCFECPAFMLPSDAPSKFKRSIGGKVCGRFGIPLGRPGQDEKALLKSLEHRAATCDSFGKDLPPLPVEKRLLVALPDPTHRVETEDQNKLDMCRTCASCEHFVRDDVVAEEFGWTSGMCSARGRLILTNELTREASTCPWRSWGMPRLEVDGIELLPEYTDDFGSYNPITAFIAAKEAAVDPSEYETDKPVSDEDAKAGIRAWRRISDEESGNETFLPIYRRDFFTDDDRDLIPNSGDEEHPELYVDHFRGVYLAAVCWMELDETPALWGEPGTGKTELFRHLAWLMQIPFRRISITGSTELDDLAGKMRFSQNEGTYFQYGRLPFAWQRPGVICIDEPNTGQPEVWQFLRPLTDNSKQLILDANRGEPIKRHDDAYLGMAMNPSWDVRNVGTIEISDADVNRLFHVFIDLPPRQLEEEIIKARVKLDGWEIDKKRLKMLMGIAEDIRSNAAEGSLPISWAIRPQIKVARALRWFDTATAYRRAVVDYLEPEAQRVIMDIINSHI